MPVRSAAAALFSGLFTLQLVLAGIVEPCTMKDMPSMAMLATTDATGSDESPCDHPVAPEQCRTMVLCAVGFLLPAGPTVAAQPAPLTETVLAALVAMPPSVSFPPKRRPPRA